MDTPQRILNAVAMYERFCDDVSVSHKRHGDNLQSMVLLFQKNLNVREAYRAVFEGDPFLDWEQADNMRAARIYRDTGAWIALLRYFDVGAADDMGWKGFCAAHRIFAHFLASLAAARLDLPVADAVQLFLLLNIMNLEVLNGVEMFFSVHHGRAVKAEALHFFSKLADLPFDRSDRTAAVTALLTHFITVSHDRFREEVDLVHSKESCLTAIFKQKHMQAASLRPRLRSKLRGRAAEQGALARLDNFRSWSDIIRFPNVFSMLNRKRLYFTMSQTRLDCEATIRRFVHEQDLAQTVTQYQVKTPDADILTDVILQARITSEPFPELHQFRERCFHSFSMQQRSKLRLNDLLHLYMAAYQADGVWKQVWKSIFPVLSIQIIRDVEAFVASTPLNHQQVMDIVFADGGDAGGRDPP